MRVGLCQMRLELLASLWCLTAAAFLLPIHAAGDRAIVCHNLDGSATPSAASCPACPPAPGGPPTSGSDHPCKRGRGHANGDDDVRPVVSAAGTGTGTENSSLISASSQQGPRWSSRKPAKLGSFPYSIPPPKKKKKKETFTPL